MTSRRCIRGGCPKQVVERSEQKQLLKKERRVKSKIRTKELKKEIDQSVLLKSGIPKKTIADYLEEIDEEDEIRMAEENREIQENIWREQKRQERENRAKEAKNEQFRQIQIYEMKMRVSRGLDCPNCGAPYPDEDDDSPCLNQYCVDRCSGIGEIRECPCSQCSRP